ncbi:hypothetical protein JTB14_035750 [Gonioctena quinquepunctata]|nr:hypothetical protein JTB14_035750 [Gonioctena quinquepunctata]
MSNEPVEKLKELYPCLKLLDIDAHINFEDNEIHLLRVPKNVDPHLLLTIDLDFCEKQKIKIGENEKYVIQPTPKTPNPTLVIADVSKIVRFESNIIMSKYVKGKKEAHIIKSEKTPMPLPNNLKNRHPLFGSNFEGKIELSEDIEKKLDDALANLIERDEKSRKKKKKKKMVQEEEPNEVIFSLLKTQNSSKDEDTGADVPDGSMNFSSYKKSKNTKQVNGSSSNNLKSETFTEYETDGGLTASTAKKKKKMKKTTNEKSSLNIKGEIFTEFETDDEEISNSVKVGRKNKKKTNENSSVNIKNEVFTEYETDGGNLPSTTKKSRKTKKTLIEEFLNSTRSELFPELGADSGVVLGSGKKSKKAKNSQNSLNIKRELVTEYETDTGVIPSKRKKLKTASDTLYKQVENRKLSLTNDSSDSEGDTFIGKYLLSSLRADEEKSSQLKVNSTSEEIISSSFNGEVSPSKKKKRKKTVESNE